MIPPLRNGRRRRCSGRDDKTKKGKPETQVGNRTWGTRPTGSDEIQVVGDACNRKSGGKPPHSKKTDRV